jgi:hypothetical protein
LTHDGILLNDPDGASLAIHIRQISRRNATHRSPSFQQYRGPPPRICSEP